MHASDFSEKKKAIEFFFSINAIFCNLFYLLSFGKMKSININLISIDNARNWYVLSFFMFFLFFCFFVGVIWWAYKLFVDIDAND